MDTDLNDDLAADRSIQRTMRKYPRRGYTILASNPGWSPPRNRPRKELFFRTARRSVVDFDRLDD